MLRLKANVLLEIGKGADNAHELALRSQRSYPAVSDYINDPPQRIDLGVLESILTNGLGLTRDQVLDLRFRDLFEFGE